MASYKETFSAYYDALTEDVDRAVIADRCEELLAQYHPKRELALDLCCGTGCIGVSLAKLGGWPAGASRLSGWMYPRRC